MFYHVGLATHLWICFSTAMALPPAKPNPDPQQSIGATSGGKGLRHATLTSGRSCLDPGSRPLKYCLPRSTHSQGFLEASVPSPVPMPLAWQSSCQEEHQGSGEEAAHASLGSYSPADNPGPAQGHKVTGWKIKNQPRVVFMIRSWLSLYLKFAQASPEGRFQITAPGK